MHLVQILRGDSFNYLTAPNEVLESGVSKRTVILAHILPSFIFSGGCSFILFSHFFPNYDVELGFNKSVIPMTFAWFLIFFFLVNGFIIELYMENTKPDYKALKKREYFLEKTKRI